MLAHYLPVISVLDGNFKMNIVSFLKKESSKWFEGLSQVNERRKQWQAFENRAVSVFEAISSEAREQKLFENLYVDSRSKRLDSAELPPFVTLFWGKHFAGFIDFTSENSGKLVVEGGCALHLSQSLSGQVACIFYPFSSQIHTPSNRYFLFKTYRCPSSINDGELHKLVKLMFSYAHISSFAGKPVLLDHIRMIWLKIRSRLRHIWHSDWVDFMFERAKKVIESKIEGLANVADESSNNAT